MVDLLGYVYVYVRVYVMSTTVPRWSTNQLLAYCHLHFGHGCSLDGIGCQLSIACKNKDFPCWTTMLGEHSQQWPRQPSRVPLRFWLRDWEQLACPYYLDFQGS